MKSKRINGILLTLAMTIGSSFTALAVPATVIGTMPNDIEIRNGDGTAPVQITLGEAFETAFFEETDLNEWYWWDYGGNYRRMPDCPAYIVHEDAVFVMPADGVYQMMLDGNMPKYGDTTKTYTEPVAAKKGDVIPLVNKEIRMSSGGDMSSYLYYLGLATDTGDGGMSGMSTWRYRVGNGSSQTNEQANVSAASWLQDSNGWRIQNADGSYLLNAWYQNTDGKWYYMGADGYMLTNTTTPDGYKVDADGVWAQ